ncbi:hypothetical protein [Virgibacillus halodenitrificans]|uniref:hypothetical protein n=1 Tax=Virgibacillus halodenitrificans TaxID=1482 RepID=UPI000382CAAD|nr:hypothetical protein [Virgibacillus halodenitrificans]
MNNNEILVVVFLPDDEYREKMMLYFFGESAIILLLSPVGLIIYSNYFDISVVNALLISILIFLLYITGRYVASGIEYTDVTTDKAYKKVLKILVIRVIGFFVILISVYLLLEGPDKWLRLILLTLSASIIWFFISLISLKRSYNKNKNLL